MAKLQTKHKPTGDNVYINILLQCPMLDEEVQLKQCIGGIGCKYFVAASAEYVECKFQETMDWREKLDCFNVKKSRRR